MDDEEPTSRPLGNTPYLIKRGIRHYRAPRAGDLLLARRLAEAVRRDGGRLLLEEGPDIVDEDLS